MGGMPCWRGGAGYRIGNEQACIKSTTTAMKVQGTLDDSESESVPGK